MKVQGDGFKICRMKWRESREQVKRENLQGMASSSIINGLPDIFRFINRSMPLL